jgi:WD40 repeat protein
VVGGTKAATLKLKGSYWVGSVAFSPDGKALASGSDGPGAAVRLWDAASGREIGSPLGHPSMVWSVAFSPSGKTLASAGGVIKIWEVATRKEIATLREKAPVRSLAFSPSGKTLASGDPGQDDPDGKRPSGAVKLWDLATGQPRATLQVNGVNAVAFSPDGKTLATGDRHGTVKLWDVPGEE